MFPIALSLPAYLVCDFGPSTCCPAPSAFSSAQHVITPSQTALSIPMPRPPTRPRLAPQTCRPPPGALSRASSSCRLISRKDSSLFLSSMTGQIALIRPVAAISHVAARHQAQYTQLGERWIPLSRGAWGR